MSDLLLQTKLFRPSLRPSLIIRSPLIERLNAGLDHARLTLISAPAGFGKTTLATTWLNTLTARHTNIGWLSLDENDNDPIRFLSYLIAALQTAVPSIGETAVTLLRSPQPPPAETILTLLINDISQYSNPLILVLDDYHVIMETAVHQALTFLLQHLPLQMHLLLTTRSDPALPLSKLRARGQMVEIRANDLRFAFDEVQLFFNQMMGLALSNEEMTALEQRTEGWIAGLQLAALSLQGHEDIPAFIAFFSGNSRYIMDYLVDEVLQQRPFGSEQFLLETAVLDRLCGPLCDAVTNQNDSQALLEQFERSNLFIVPLDDQRKWYRYHPLFADVLRNRLQQTYPDILPTLYQRASVWCEAQKLVLEAIEYALRAMDFERAASLIKADGPTLAFQGQLQTLLNWFNQLPQAQLTSNPDLLVYHASALMFTNQLEAAAVSLQLAEQAAQAQGEGEAARLVLGHVAAIRADLYRISGHLEEAFLQAQQALDLLPQVETTPLKLRASALLDRARAFHFTGDVNQVHEQFASSIIPATRASGNLYATLNSVINLANLQKLQGRLRQSEATYAAAFSNVKHPQQINFLFGGAAYYFGLGELYRERSQLETAADYLQQGVALVNSTIIVDAETVTLGFIALSRLQQNQGDVYAAHATLNTLAQIGQQRHFASHLLTRGAAAQAQLWVAQNNLTAAAAWADNSQFNLTDAVAFSHESHYLALVRVRLAQRRLAGLRPLLERLLTTAIAHNRQHSVIEILLCQALLAQAENDQPSALNSIQQALDLAEPEGFVRTFVDEGEPLRLLLLAYRAQAETKPHLLAYANRLLAAFPLPGGQPAPQLDPILDALSERELEVLRLVAGGASNRDIADDLFLAVTTVKKHISNIMSKLNASSRTQAVAEAHTLGLL